MIVASHDPSFGEKNNQVSARSVWVSNLALVTRQRSNSVGPSGFVLDAISGEPVTGATVRLWQRDRQGWVKPMTATATDADGRFTFVAPQGSFFLLA